MQSQLPRATSLTCLHFPPPILACDDFLSKEQQVSDWGGGGFLLLLYALSLDWQHLEDAKKNVTSPGLLLPAPQSCAERKLALEMEEQCLHLALPDWKR